MLKAVEIFFYFVYFVIFLAF